jgi:hypothetical protein
MVVARIALSERKFPEALAASQKALALAGTKLKRTAIAATFTSGLAQTLSGSAAGRLKGVEAVDMARKVGDPLLLAEALLVLAEGQLQSGNSADALKAALEAQDLSARIGSPDTELLALQAAARASRSVGDSQGARDYATRADKLLGGFQQLWGSDNYNSFLNRPDIQILRAQLNQLLAQTNQTATDFQGGKQWETVAATSSSKAALFM